MRHIFLSIACLWASAFTFAQTTLLDDVFEDFLIAEGIDTDGKNGSVLTSSIVNELTLDFTGFSGTITSLQGIEDFTSLRNLICTNQGLTSLDVSNNLDLKKLWINDNNLTALDLSQNVELRNLRCGQNQLTALDVSNNTLLTALYCYGNSISTLDVSNNTLLVRLLCNSNTLTSIDVSQNTSLTHLHVQSNNLTTLDVSNNDQLIELRCNNNQLTTLNVKNGNNTILTTFYATGNPDLICTEVDDVSWSSANWTIIDPQNNFSLDCASFNEPMTDIPDENFELALQAYDNNPIPDGKIPTANIEFLTNLDVSGAGITDLTGIEDFKALEILILDNNALQSINLSENVSLRRIHCNSNQLTSIDVSNQPDLTRLWCNNNNLTSLDITSNTALTDLRCGQNNLSTLNVTQNTGLTSLYCFGNQLNTLNVSNNPQLVRFYCSSNNLTTLLVTNNTSLTHLHAQNNALTKLDISNNNQLIELRCNNNQLTELNLKNGNNTDLTTLFAQNNPYLSCIQVDDVNNANWVNIDAESSYSEDCLYGITFIPDPNFEQVLIDANYDQTKILDGQVPTSMIENVQFLSLYDKGITDITGIEDFRNLKQFTCQYNPIENIDLSKNPLLERVIISYNDVQSVDISNLNNLTYLTLFGNQLSNINLSGTENIETCYLGRNNFISLDLSALNKLEILNLDQNYALEEVQLNAPVLESLTISNTNISNLDVSSCISLKTLNCGTSNISAINFGAINEITQLSCNETSLIELDVSSLEKIEYLYLRKCSSLENLSLGFHPALKTLLCNNTKLASLDVSGVGNIEILDCSYTNLTSLIIENKLNLVSLDVRGANLIELFINNTPVLNTFYGYNNELEALVIQTGNNPGINNLNLGTSNRDLYCVQVDDPAWSQANWPSFGPNAVFSSQCEFFQTAIPDPNFEQALIDLGHDDILDGKVSTKVIREIKSLVINNYNINDLTGIEEFEALTKLWCQNNNLTSLDLHSNIHLKDLRCGVNKLSSLKVYNNKKLTYLNCYNNQLSHLDVRNNTDLSRLYCNNNTLTSLDLSNNTSLTHLHAQINELTFIDLTNNTALTEVRCNRNQLRVIDFRNGQNQNIVTFKSTDNPYLFCIEVDDPNYSESNWTDIDPASNFVSECTQYTYVPDLQFERAMIANGWDDVEDSFILTENVKDVTYFSVPRFRNIYDITGIEAFVNLEQFSIEDNAVTTLDLSKNIKLTSVACSGNRITSVSIPTTVTTLDLGRNRLTELDLSEFQQLYTVGVYQNDLTSINFGNVDIHRINISDNELTSIDVSNQLNLEYFYCDNNNLIALDLSNNEDLRFLECNNNELNALDLSNNSKLQDLDCSFNNLSTLDVSNKAFLYEVYCHDNNITSIVFNNSSLRKLLCSNNQLTNLNFEGENSIELFELRCLNNKLSSLNIKGSNFFNPSYFDIRNNPELFCVEVEDAEWATNNLLNKDEQTGYSESCFYYLRTAIKDANFEQALIDLGIETESLDGYVRTDLIESITELNIANKNIADLSGIEAFTSLENLDCSNNNISSVDFSNNVLLTHLNCSNNTINNLDLSLNNLLVDVNVSNNLLECLNIANGNNQVLTSLDATNNIPLSCIQVDDETQANWTNIDPQSSYVNYCKACNETYVPNDRFEEFLIWKGYDEGPLDNYVLNENIKDVLNLNIPYYFAISDFTGIEGFTNLETFYINYLNASPSPIVSLDLSKNTKLQEFEARNTHLEEIDLSKNTNLTHFFMSYCYMDAISLRNGNNQNITTYYSVGNGNACIEVDDPAWSGANWTNVDNPSQFTTECLLNDTYVPDDAFEAALIALGIDEGPLDDYVPTDNVISVTELELNGLNISDLTGIEDFKYLTSLDCSDNNISNLDISNSIYLSALNCSSNQLASLDISSNVDLETLNIADNQINGINIGNCTQLTTFNCEQNLISSMDLSSNIDLLELDCSNNLLSELDLLSNVALSLFDCSSNNLTTIDLNQNTSLSSVDISNNNLTAVNLKNGNNPQITTFDATGNINELCIDVDDEEWSYNNWINIGPQTIFSNSCFLYYHVAIPDVNFELALIANNVDESPTDGYVLRSDAEATYQLNLHAFQITDLTGIEAFTNLTNLTCSSNELTELDLSNSPYLQYFTCSDNELSTLDLSNNTNLISLDCSQNQLTTITFNPGTPSLSTVKLYQNNLTTVELPALNNISTLDIQENNLTSVDLSNIHRLQYLNCYVNQLIDLDISNNTMLTNLDCSDNLLTSLDLSQNNSINYFAFQNNNISTIDVSNLASLYHISCAENPISELDLSQNNALISLHCLDTDITNLDLSDNLNLQWLDVRYSIINTLDLSFLENLTMFICSYSNLSYVDLRNGNNENLDFLADNLYSSLCVDVDDPTYSNQNWINSPNITYSSNCSSLPKKGSFTLINLEVYPNPASSNLFIETTEKVSYELISVSGEVMGSGEIISGLNSIDVSLLPDGVYFLNLQGENINQVEKIVIQ